MIDDTKRGVWSLMPLGWNTKLDPLEAQRILANRVKLSQPAAVADHVARSKELQEVLSLDVLQELSLLDVLKSLPPSGFALLCERLLREHGFEDVQVTQRSRDGGIDGYGVLRLSPFVNTKVAFQAKRYIDFNGGGHFVRFRISRNRPKRRKREKLRDGRISFRRLSF